MANRLQSAHPKVPTMYRTPDITRSQAADAHRNISPSQFKAVLKCAAAPSHPPNQLTPEYSAASKINSHGDANQQGGHCGDERTAKEVHVALRAQKRAKQIQRASPLAGHFSIALKENAAHALGKDTAPSPKVTSLQFHSSTNIIGYNGQCEKHVAFTKTAVGRKEGKTSATAVSLPGLAQLTFSTTPKGQPQVPLSEKRHDQNVSAIPNDHHGVHKGRSKRSHSISLPSFPLIRIKHSSSATIDVGFASTPCSNVGYSVDKKTLLPHAADTTLEARLAPLPRYNPYHKRPRAQSLSSLIPDMKFLRPKASTISARSVGAVSNPHVINDLFQRINQKAARYRPIV